MLAHGRCRPGRFALCRVARRGTGSRDLPEGVESHSVRARHSRIQKVSLRLEAKANWTCGQSETTACRLDGGLVIGACRRGGSSAKRSPVAAAMLRTAFSKATSVAADVVLTPLTLRTYCRAADSISSTVASGSSPRSVVMFRHMPSG